MRQFIRGCEASTPVYVLLKIKGKNKNLLLKALRARNKKRTLSTRQLIRGFEASAPAVYMLLKIIGKNENLLWKVLKSTNRKRT